MPVAVGERPAVRGIEQEWAAIAGVLAALRARGLHDDERADEVAALAVAVGSRMGLGASERRDLEELAALHDIGLIGIPDSILGKADPLTPQERIRLCTHPLVGASILDSLDDLARLAPYVTHEHEQWDGAGYPDGLSGDEIPLQSRILLACDAYVAMRRPRPDRPALPAETAVGVLRRNAGTQFCPHTVDVLLDVIEGPAAEPRPAPAAEAEPTPVPAPEPVRAPRVRRSEPLLHRLSLRGFAASALAGAVVGALLALPPADVTNRCPPAKEGQVYCVLQKAWLPAAVEILACMIAAVALATLVFVTLPRWRRGELRRHRSPWPDPKDRLLAAASWTLTFDDAHGHGSRR